MLIKKKYFAIMYLVMCFYTKPIYCEVIGDINDDNHVGLQEAIYALQITSGLKTTTTNLIDFTEYFFISDATYYYKKNILNNNETYYNFYYTTSENIDNEDILILSQPFKDNILYGCQYLFALRKGSICHIGYKDLKNGTVEVYSPPQILGNNQINMNDTFATCSEYQYFVSQNKMFCSEYKFIGIEDVTTPAGSFTDCIKLLVNYHTINPNSYDGNSTFSLRYYAKNIGLVKHINTGSYVNEVIELTFAKVGNNVYNQGNIYNTCTGSYSFENAEGQQETDQFKLTYVQINDGFKGELVIIDDTSNILINTAQISSDDGINFIGGNDIFNNEVSFTIENQVMNGMIVDKGSISGKCEM